VWNEEEESDLPPWLAAACVANDLWLWEEEDEEYIEEFAKSLPPSFLETATSVDSEYWDAVYEALETRQSRTMASPLTHVTPRVRLCFVAWLILVGHLRKDSRLDPRSNADLDIETLIFFWAKSLNLHDWTTRTCNICRVSQVLPMWTETMLQVYSLDDLRTIPWYDKCNCFNR
jgi:hypothetical protein